jgi:hypothetical protein
MPTDELDRVRLMVRFPTPAMATLTAVPTAAAAALLGTAPAGSRKPPALPPPLLLLPLWLPVTRALPWARCSSDVRSSPDEYLKRIRSGVGSEGGGGGLELLVYGGGEGGRMSAVSYV